jgi:choline kinase
LGFYTLNAIILAAGEGTRLRPLTNDKPKGLVELFGKSILERQIDIFMSCGITDISIVTGFNAEMIQFPYINYFHNPNFKITNMVETLFCAKEKLNESSIISYGDIIFEKSVLEKLINSEYDISVIIDLAWKDYWKVRFENPLEDAESLILNNGYIADIGQKYQKLE